MHETLALVDVEPIIVKEFSPIKSLFFNIFLMLIDRVHLGFGPRFFDSVKQVLCIIGTMPRSSTSHSSYESYIDIRKTWLSPVTFRKDGFSCCVLEFI